MKVSGILETALSVAAPAASAAIYKRLLGFDTLLDTDRLVRYRRNGIAGQLRNDGSRR